jgi:OHCU decarboxylase
MVGERASAAFGALDALSRRADEVWRGLASTDWDEAFRAHPRIGEQKAAGHQSTVAKGWSSAEQEKVSAAGQAVKDELAAVNRAYEERFGRIYIVCATGKTAEEMLAIAKERMKNDPETELRRAADEQARITALRLAKLVNGGS